jgi:hypothetical protein
VVLAPYRLWSVRGIRMEDDVTTCRSQELILALIQAGHVTTIGGPYGLQAFDEMQSGVLEPSVGVERAGATLVISRPEAPGVPYFYRHGLPPFLPATSAKTRRDGYDRTAGAGGVFFPDRGGSAWITAHWGWMPPREYTAFLQIGHVGLVEIGVCRCLSATRFNPFESRRSPRRRDARRDAPPPDDAWIDQ